MHDWPATRRNFIATAPSSAASKSQSSNTMKGALPPSLNDSRLIWRAAVAMIPFPTSVEPVKPILRISGCVSSSAPTRPERLVVSTLSTPAGSPASWVIRAMASAVSGVADAGLRTTVQPAARAGAIFRVTMVAGKFHGVTAATGPIGWWSTQYRFPGVGEAIHSPAIRRASSANQPKYPSENWTSFFASSNGLPFSSVTSRARSSRRTSMSSWIRRRNRPRSLGACTDHSRKAACAAATARSTSGTAPLVTRAMTERSAGLMTSNAAPPSACTHSPLMYMRSTSATEPLPSSHDRRSPCEQRAYAASARCARRAAPSARTRSSRRARRRDLGHEPARGAQQPRVAVPRSDQLYAERQAVRALHERHAERGHAAQRPQRAEGRIPRRLEPLWCGAGGGGSQDGVIALSEQLVEALVELGNAGQSAEIVERAHLSVSRPRKGTGRVMGSGASRTVGSLPAAP